MTDATFRLNQAYTANNIPWDPKLENLTDKKANETAEYWEERANVDAWQPPTIQDCRELIGSIQPVPPNGSQSGRIRTAVDIAYHGSGGAIRD